MLEQDNSVCGRDTSEAEIPCKLFELLHEVALPLPACGERSDRIEDAIRVRGTFRQLCCGGSP